MPTLGFFRHVPSFFEHFSAARCSRFVLSLPSPRIISLLLAPLSGESNLEAKICTLGVLIATEMSLFPSNLLNSATYMYAYKYVCVHMYAYMCVLEQTNTFPFVFTFIYLYILDLSSYGSFNPNSIHRFNSSSFPFPYL